MIEATVERSKKNVSDGWKSRGEHEFSRHGPCPYGGGRGSSLVSLLLMAVSCSPSLLTLTVEMLLDSQALQMITQTSFGLHHSNRLQYQSQNRCWHRCDSKAGKGYRYISTPGDKSLSPDRRYFLTHLVKNGITTFCLWPGGAGNAILCPLRERRFKRVSRGWQGVTHCPESNFYNLLTLLLGHDLIYC